MQGIVGVYEGVGEGGRQGDTLTPTPTETRKLREKIKLFCLASQMI